MTLNNSPRPPSSQEPSFGWLAVVLIAALALGCGSEEASTGADGSGGERPKAEGGGESTQEGKGKDGERRGGESAGGGRGGPPGGFGGGVPAEERGVPVEVTAAARLEISSYLETQGTLEAENEVDLVARTAGPVVLLQSEEGRRVAKGDLLARLDDRELQAQLEVSNVRLEETERNFERVKSLHHNQLVSQEAFDQALAEFDSAKGEFERTRLQLEYTEIRAPFAGRIVQRYIKLAEHVQVGAPLFRLSDFDPLLCPIQVPERELPRLRDGQRAELEVEAWPGQRFVAKVLRVSPVIDSASGTVRVTLEVGGEGKLRPGMFASVFLEMERRENALVIPKGALALDSLGDTVFVVAEGVAERRSLDLGFRSDQLLEVRSGLEEGERVIIVGQDGLGEGTPVEVLGERPLPSRNGSDVEPSTSPPTQSPAKALEAESEGRGGGPGGSGPPGGRGGPGGGFNIDWDDPEQVERVKQRMRDRGLSESQVEERLKMIRERMSGG